MTVSANCPLAGALAQRLRDEREDLIERWLERIKARVTLQENEIFPTQAILDHVPLLVEGIADYLEDPVEEITADIPVIAKAMELGELRHEQGFDAYEILKEYEILGGVLFDFLIRTADDITEPCTRGELLVCGHRLFRSISVIQQFTTSHFLRLAEQRVQDREERLRRFNRSISHEMKNRMGVIGGAAAILDEDEISHDPVQVRKFLRIVSSNVGALNETLNDLIELSRLDVATARARNILLPEAAAEVKRQLREFAEARSVSVELDANLPEVEVPAAAVELALTNYISNAVKYRDPDEPEPWVRVGGELVQENGKRMLQVCVRDNGRGVPEGARTRLFERFFRADADSDEEGSGLGLSLVRETIESLGGHTWVDFPGKGSRFGLAIPCPEDDGGGQDVLGD